MPLSHLEVYLEARSPSAIRSKLARNAIGGDLPDEWMPLEKVVEKVMARLPSSEPPEVSHPDKN
jgi:hypothetical protein